MTEIAATQTQRSEVPRPYTQADYELVCRLWTAQGWPILPPDFLPDTGYVVSYEGKDVCVGFVYESNSKVIWMEFIVADPTVDKDIRSQCIDTLITELLHSSKEKGFKYAMISTEHPRLIERLNRHQFVPTDSGMTNLVRRI